MPKVSIGLPVYNGKPFLTEAIDSLLAQTFTDFELVIVDNASTDGSSEICREYARRDNRVRYHHNGTNIGGGKNHNRAFELANAGQYFKFAAHDDRHAPTFLERCVDVLDRDPSVVLAFPKADFIDADGKITGSRELTLPLADPDLQVRFRALLEPYDCLEGFGLMRRAAADRLGTPLIRLHSDGDGVFLLRLIMLGRFVEIPETLFFNRHHPEQTSTKLRGNGHAWAAWWDPALRGRRLYPHWRRRLEIFRGVAEAPVPLRERLNAAAAAAQWTRWTRHQLYGDVAFHVKDAWRSSPWGKPHPQ